MKIKREIKLATNSHLIKEGKQPKPLLYQLPEPGEQFSYVIAKIQDSVDLKGCKVYSRKGDRMEFAHVARQLDMKVDISYYLINYIVGLCARFINYDEHFQPAGAKDLSEKFVDEQSQKAAKKFLERFIKDINKKNNELLQDSNVIHTRFNHVCNIVRKILSFHIGIPVAEIIHNACFRTDIDESSIINSVRSYIDKFLQKLADTILKSAKINTKGSIQKTVDDILNLARINMDKSLQKMVDKILDSVKTDMNESQQKAIVNTALKPARISLDQSLQKAVADLLDSTKIDIDTYLQKLVDDILKSARGSLYKSLQKLAENVLNLARNNNGISLNKGPVYTSLQKAVNAILNSASKHSKKIFTQNFPNNVWGKNIAKELGIGVIGSDQSKDILYNILKNYPYSPIRPTGWRVTYMQTIQTEFTKRLRTNLYYLLPDLIMYYEAAIIELSANWQLDEDFINIFTLETPEKIISASRLIFPKDELDSRFDRIQKIWQRAEGVYLACHQIESSSVYWRACAEDNEMIGN
ncbi:15662_t:CDS:1 [Funneliformis geosporum]|uniref:3919_t:CDS:1 n=1 Tax=Funneliformis geosporum TaxID=1117311 RepID=A0A9W4WR96_9GLOM|nr:3919_t:CDS:1 [Funneliformis geosporum]CAI2176763.1 15662_t:CDS:1 [Funneliformis geosporum]